MSVQKIKTDCEAADLKKQFNCTTLKPESKAEIAKTRIYRAPDGSGILAAVETEDGTCYIGYFSTVKRRYRRADLRAPRDIRYISAKALNPDESDLSAAQKRLDAYAERLHLRELPLTIGGEI